MWVIGEDISKICMKYRDNVIQKCISKEILSINEELALNYIFLFQEENPQGLYEYFDDELWKCAFSEIRTQYPYINIPENVFDLCGNVVKVMNKFKAFNRKFFNKEKKRLSTGFLGRCYIINFHYEGVYQMILLGEFKFPKDPTTWGSLMSCFQILATIQDLVNKWAIKYQYATRKGSNQEIPSNIKLKRKCFIPR
ncbi:hypothetical protein C2G38_2040592 [Gigaspora rosea]|uniref:Uncharacterized protein n=1 Tax=Gigaspora rosea TaxID=44941 RepID=A0A397UUV8_9GLOM|nr:hypothetical protein C2G38_2040592 [Gigaspora rosea]